MHTIPPPAVLIAATIFSVSLALLLHWATLTALFRWLPRSVRVHPPSFAQSRLTAGIGSPTPDRLSSLPRAQPESPAVCARRVPFSSWGTRRAIGRPHRDRKNFAPPPSAARGNRPLAIFLACPEADSQPKGHRRRIQKESGSALRLGPPPRPPRSHSHWPAGTKAALSNDARSRTHSDSPPQRLPPRAPADVCYDSHRPLRAGAA
jgi:hypothetical protein